jgi:hypothetical protein
MKTMQSALPFNYMTIRVTKSRIAKDLLAIPISLIDHFPKNKTQVYVSFEEDLEEHPLAFTPYTSSSGECRIGGMRKFYQRFQVRDGDELVLQILGDNKYRIFTETKFENSIRNNETTLDNSINDDEAGHGLRKISEITNTDFHETVLSEYFRLSANEFEKRRRSKPSSVSSKASMPANIRKILAEIYGGKCQVTQFGFLMKNGRPYFEVHHIDPELGNHLKNILVVSPNTHALFTYAHVEHYKDEEGWLRRVKFNNEEYRVNHVIDEIPRHFEKTVHSL